MYEVIKHREHCPVCTVVDFTYVQCTHCNNVYFINTVIALKRQCHSKCHSTDLQQYINSYISPSIRLMKTVTPYIISAHVSLYTLLLYILMALSNM